MKRLEPQVFQPPPLLLLLLLLLLRWTIADDLPADSPERLLSSATSSTGAGAACPCAYLERGGFWSSDVAAALGVEDGVFVESRCRCDRRSNCDRRWRRSEKSLTVQWIGASGVRDSEMQLQFCKPIHPSALPACAKDQVSFRLRQIGWWLDLQAVLCRCPQLPPQQLGAAPNAFETGSSISGFIYARPAAASRGPTLTSRIVEFVCDSKPRCLPEQPCYLEPSGPAGQAVRGSVLCSCPPGAFCPIYLVPDATPAPEAPTDAAANASDTASGLSLRCRLEPGNRT